MVLASKFQTYGPYELVRSLGEVKAASLEKLWSQAAVDDKQLSAAIGVYIIAMKSNTANYVPWYVGKTDKGFSSRFKQHIRYRKSFGDIGRVPGNDPFHIFLIPRMTPLSEEFRKKTAPGEHVKSIDRLEFMLIASCIAVNPHLLNRSNKVFHLGLSVPGYVNDVKPTRNKSAKRLAKMLRVQ